MKYEISESKIEGKGVIATKNLKKGDYIGIAIKNIQYGGILFNITEELGKYINHAEDATGKLIKQGDKYILKAKKAIKKGEEVAVNYYNTPWFILGPNPTWE